MGRLCQKASVSYTKSLDERVLHMKISLKKYAAWIPAILIAIAIFLFSSQPADESTTTSNGVIRILIDFAGKLNIVDLEHTDPDILYKILQTPIRKGAHITEFAVLNLSLLFALSFWDMKGVKWVRTAFLLTVLYACTDEFHQIFVPGRAGLIRDVLIDSIGPTVIMGSYVLVRLLKMGKKHI